jgi:hypothetical protein
MDDKASRSSREAKKKAVEALDTSSVVNPGTKKRSASTHKQPGLAKKARKTTPSAASVPSVPSAPSTRVDKGAEDVDTQFHKTPGTKRQSSLCNLIEHEVIYASDMQKQIAAEARGVSRKNVPWDEFCSIYLCDFNTQTEPKPTVKSVRKIGEDNWEVKLFWNRLRRSLSDEVRYSGYALIRLSPLLTY